VDMDTTTSVVQPANGARLRLLTFPREHGAWGILLVPLVTGAAIGYQSPTAILPLILLTLAALALFCLRTPLESWLAASPLRPQTPAERHAVESSIIAFAAVSGAALAALLWLERAWSLLILGAAVAAIFLAQTILKKLGRQTRTRAQLMGSLGLTSTAAAAYYLATGKLDATALVLWGVNWVFAANQIHFVQLRIHAARAMTRAEKWARGRAFILGEFLALIVLALGWRWGYLPGLVILAFAPVFLRGGPWLLSSHTAPLEVRRLGKSELAHAMIFGALLIASFRLGAV
jgi:YwiC-like protein